MSKYTQVTIDRSSLAKEEQFCSEILKNRIKERIGDFSEAGKKLDITLKTEKSLAQESYRIVSKSGTVQIAGGDRLGVIFGIGKFLRKLQYRTGKFTCGNYELASSPQASLRQAYFATHFHNWYHMATDKELERYIEDLALWGINSIHTIVIPVINLDDKWDSPEIEERFQKFDKMCRLIKRMGMKVGGGGFVNQSFRNAPKEFYAVPNTDPARGNNGINLCPERPGAHEYIMKNFETYIKRLAKFPVDLYRFWPYDEGGCDCEKCSPWGGRGFLKLSKEMMAMVKQYLPNAKIILSTWTFHDDEWANLDEYLKKENWIDYVLADAHGNYPEYPLNHTLKGVKLINFPEISMWGRFPWGGYGATPLAGRFSMLWQQVRGKIDGGSMYSEGIYEDINKIVVSQLYWDAAADTNDVLREYASYELSGIPEEEFLELARLLEANHLLEPEDAGKARQAAKLAHEIMLGLDKKILPPLKDSWRWRLFVCRAILDYEHFVKNDPCSKESIAALQELVDLYRSEQNAGDYNDPMHSAIRPKLN